MNINTKKKKFSIIVPFKNISKENDDFFKALNRNNHINQFELIFVFSDKYSNYSETKEKIKKIVKHNFVLIQDKEANSGPSRCWCIGLKVAQGKYICFLAGDVIPDENWCLSVIKNVNSGTSKKFWIGNIANSYTNENKYNYIEKIEMQIDKRRSEELIVDFRNFIGKKDDLMEIINNFFCGKYFTDIELDFVLKDRIGINPFFLTDLVVYNKYPRSFLESTKRKFKHGVGNGRISKMFVDKFRKVHSAGIFELYLGIRILFKETKRAKLSFSNKLTLALFNVVFLAGMFFGIIMPKFFVKKYYSFHFDEK